MREQRPATLEAEVLLCCARARLDPARASRLEKLVQEDVDWARLLRIARSHGMLPLLCAHLGATCAAVLPGAVLNRFHAEFQGNSRRNLFLSGELIKLVRALEAERIPALAYRGPTLAALAYDNLALRQFLDLDLLVRTQDVRRAAAVLAEHGYRNRSAAPMRPVQEAALLRFLCELHFTRDDGRSQVDLHWDILPRMFAFAVDTESLWTRSGRTSLGGTTVRTLSPEDLLLILCVHNTKHRWERLGWMVDVAELIEHQAMDWDQVFDRARRLNSERMLRLGLFLASDLLGVALPPRVSDRAHADPTVRSLAIRAFEGLFTGPDTPTEEVVDFRFYFKARERWRDRARFTLQVITTPTLNEVSLVALPGGLSFLYYPLRPLRLAAKYGRALCART